MRYNYNELARNYVRGFYKFLLWETDIKRNEDAYLLFRYSIKKICGMEVSEINESILKYGDKCINYLKGLKGVPKHMEKIGFEDRVHLFDYCETYLVSIHLLALKEREVVVNENR